MNRFLYKEYFRLCELICTDALNVSIKIDHLAIDEISEKTKVKKNNYRINNEFN